MLDRNAVLETLSYDKKASNNNVKVVDDMDSLMMIPFIFLGLIVLLLIWAMIFMKSYKKDKQRLATFVSSDKDAVQQESLYLEMAESYESKGDPEKALEYYYLYLRKVSGNPVVYFRVGKLLSVSNPEEAVSYWEKAATYGHQQAVEKLKAINNIKDEDKSEE